MTIRLKNWAVVGNPYSAPETRVTKLLGNVYGHPNYVDGAKVVTSAVVSSKGRLIKCATRDYLLDGAPDEDYVKFCYENKILLDEENPIRVV